jgi:16S rRNA (guanine527-N7)-methyltransferase
VSDGGNSGVNRSALIDGAAALGLTLAPKQVEQFERYAIELIEWNRRINLTAITDPNEIVRKHFLDSLSPIAAGDLEKADHIVDVGSGAGFPGLPIKIARPELRLTLLEATRKKCEFLRRLAAVLQLSDVTIVNARAEDAGRDPAHRERYEVATARAVAEMSTLAEYTLPLVRVGGRVTVQKSGKVEAEVERARTAIATLGGRLQRIAPLNVPGLEENRYLVVVEKFAPPPDTYPRRAGVPEKRPLR